MKRFGCIGMQNCQPYCQTMSIAFAYNAHGTLGGVSTWARGGSFWSGFASGAVASFVSTSTGIMTAELPKVWQVSCMVAAGGLSGGITSSMAGGDFWDGVCNGLICAGLNHAMHLACESLVGPDDPPKSQKNNTAEKIQNATNKGGAGLTPFGGALEVTKLQLGGKLEGVLGKILIGTKIFAGLGVVSNAVINYVRYDSGEITLYSMFARDAMTLMEFGMSKTLIGIIPSIALMAHDIEGGFEQTLYNDVWVKTQIQSWDQHLYQFRPDPGYQPIYYRHGK